MLRRTFLATAAASFATPSLSFDQCTIFKGDHMAGLANGFGFAVGPQDRDKDVVAMVAPWCGYCRILMQDAIAGVLPFNVKFVPTQANGALDRTRVAEVLFAPGPDKPEIFHDRTASPKPSMDARRTTFINNVQDITLDIMKGWRSQFQDGPMNGTPVMIYPYDDGNWIFTGYERNHVLKYADELVPYALPGSFSTRETLDLALSDEPFEGTVMARDANAALRILPRAGALPFTCVEKGVGFEVDYVINNADERWFVLEAGETRLFASESEFELV
ncbi:hypothetical protein [Mariluticola halotolerans]|uniref:hypothetical protein n=1 Tax=Mariluticola halotolerans TaxID=2909283 RepID=UPI0026E46D14|nr:hypothetical protein [Mariluticola halotolerans]UJQ92992.1 hypothetical protein L1P08_08140 [Mariluticola halotolerans]